MDTTQSSRRWNEWCLTVTRLVTEYEVTDLEDYPIPVQFLEVKFNAGLSPEDVVYLIQSEGV